MDQSLSSSLVPIDPKKLIGKNLSAVIERMKILNLKYRVVTKNGLITAEYIPNRYNLLIDGGDDCNGTIIDCELG